MPNAQKSKSIQFQSYPCADPFPERDDILKNDFPLDGSAYDDVDDDDEWGADDNTWTEGNELEEESDTKDESSAYLEFLSEEVQHPTPLTILLLTNKHQAQKFQNLEDDDSDDELGEESLLETPLDKIEPYQLFRDAMISTHHPPFHNMNPTNTPKNSKPNNPNSSPPSPAT